MSQKPFFKSRFFKLPQYKQFDFPARYYDPEKERRDKRKEEMKEQNYNLRIKNSFQKSQKKDWNKSWETIRLIIIFTILIAGFVFIYNQIDDILKILNSSIK